ASAQPDENAMLRLAFGQRGLAFLAKGQRAGGGGSTEGRCAGGMKKGTPRDLVHGTNKNSGELTMAQRTSSARSRHSGRKRAVGVSPKRAIRSCSCLMRVASGFKWLDQETGRV